MRQRPRHSERVIREALLRADSPREAFYRIRVGALPTGIGYVIRKESGTGEHVTHREAWFRDTLQETLDFFKGKIAQKTNPNRKRVYRIEILREAPSPTQTRTGSRVHVDGLEQPSLF